MPRYPSALWLACALAVVERALKVASVGSTMEAFLVDTGVAALSLEGMVQLAYCALLMGVRYVAAANRHIAARRAGTEMQIATLCHYQRRRLAPSGDRAAGSHALLQTVGNATMERYSRIAIDLVPGLVSIAAGAYQYVRLVTAPHCWCALFFLVVVDALHKWVCVLFRESEDRLAEQYAEGVGWAHALAQEAVTNAEAVNAFARHPHETRRFEAACERFRAVHARYERLCNYWGSLRHWIGHVINAALIWVARDHTRHGAPHLVMVLFYASEIRSGLEECRYYQRQVRQHAAYVRALERGLAPAPAADTPSDTPSDTPPDTRAIDTGIELRNVTVSFCCGERRRAELALSRVSFVLAPGSFTVLLGENGAGKTTLFRILRRHCRPCDGDVVAPPPGRVLTCLQEPALFASESVAYNVAYGCEALLAQSAAAHAAGSGSGPAGYASFGEAVVRAAAMLGIEELEHKSVAALSGGERQRLGLARVLAAALERPEHLALLLLDEHDSALDCRGRQLACEAVRHVRRATRCTTLCITHTALCEAAATTADYRALKLRAGRLVDEGAYAAVWARHVRLLSNASFASKKEV